MAPTPTQNGFTPPDSVLASWQNVVDTLAQIIAAPAASIVRVHGALAEVVCTSQSPSNPWKKGDQAKLADLYTARVVETTAPLIVANALEDAAWGGPPRGERGMVAYLGVPLCWPHGKIFGSLCLLDSKGRRFEKDHEKMVTGFKELVEFHLRSVDQDLAELEDLEGVLDSLSEGIIAHDRDRRIRFFNRAAEEITGYDRKEVLGKDCHQAFGAPFCGRRCSFLEGPPPTLEDLYYPINILSKQGQPRRVEMAINARKDDQGHLTGVIASFRDVTDLIGLKIRTGDLEGFAGIVGKDPKMLQVYSQIRELGTNHYPVHISGETGTGKELVAQAIHNESRRGGGPFVPVNCAALPEGVLETELFGHVKGAFTGAVRDKRGRFELAHKGTLFLDEVADLPSAVQAKLLRVLQEGAFERVGDEKTTTVDIRLISASNKDLKQEVERGNFRQDLFYRVNVVPIHLPPLRQRKGDIPLLVEHLMRKAQDEGQMGTTVSKEALRIMRDYPWPGNVRELQSAIRFAMVRSKGRVIAPEHLPMELILWRKRRSPRGPARKLDPDTVRVALAQAAGNKAKAARILGVGRATLYRFLADYPDVS